MEPMTFQDLVIIYNGETYNYLEIRKELISFYEFASQTDTEVILKRFINGALTLFTISMACFPLRSLIEKMKNSI